MKKTFTSVAIVLFMSLFLWGCAANMPVEVMPQFTPHHFNADQYSPAVDNFLVIIDASGSMDENYRGNKKFIIEKTLVDRMNQTIPELGQKCGLRFFGHDESSPKASALLYGMSTYSTAQFGKSLNKIKGAWGESPLNVAINAAGNDFASLSGTKALIVISDAKGMVSETSKAIDAAKLLKKKFGSSLCIYPILIGNDAKGTSFMKKLAEVGGCGFFSKADDLLTSAGMAKYVEDVFLSMEKKPVLKDSDHDGVYDNIDKCPGTPENVAVDADGCPFDSDKDGVFDYLDKCPDTPKGAPVDVHGCWIISNILFDFNKYQIKSDAFSELNIIAEVMQKNPSLKIMIQGHTDNIGSKAYNQKLSVERAKAAKQYLVKKGVAPNRLMTEGFGFSRPVASNATPQGRALNRRVQFSLIR